jgi:hypothetical protein
MAQAPFPVNPDLTAVSIAYTNELMVADQVLPRVSVGKQDFKYFKANLVDPFTVPDTRVGRKSTPNMVETGGTEVTDSTADYALRDAIPLADLQNADSRWNPRVRAVTYISDLLALDREVRVANLVTTLANYPSTQRATLSGTSQWSDFTNSDPISAILSAMDAMIMRPNTLVMGRAVLTQLMQHPRVVQTINKTSQSKGVVMRQAIADIFEIPNIVVGEGWVNTARKGQAASYTRAWGKHCALLNVDGTGQRTFGFTAQWGQRMAGSDFDRDIGMRGGEVVQVGESVKEVIAESTLGYFFQNAVA